MNNLFFVILNHPTEGMNGVPLTDDDDLMLFFPSREDAMISARSSFLGSVAGFEVFMLGAGEYSE